MWVITVFSDGRCSKIYEYDTENEAREAYNTIHGYKILTEMVYLEPTSPLDVNLNQKELQLIR
ncbi:hypothetical protein [Neobacillus drentensis]|jgi:hypothetical protein|uniref:hypothetical protein n=1 Tax=Neobacillus drentensis TaxID=220684 RepID=UPI000BF7BBFB|nr:hypothetical protein CN481_18480 [Bacillus sp. AFS006103]